MGLLLLSPDLQRDAVAHGTARSSHVRPRFLQPAIAASHHHKLPILPVASISSISSPPAWNGRQVCLSSRHNYRSNTPRILRISWSAKLRLLCRDLSANSGARPSTEAASSNPKTRQRHYGLSPPSRIYNTTWMNILTPAHFCSTSASCQQSVAFPTTGMSAPPEASASRNCTPYSYPQELPWLCTTRFSREAAEHQGRRTRTSLGPGQGLIIHFEAMPRRKFPHRVGWRGHGYGNLLAPVCLRNNTTLDSQNPSLIIMQHSRTHICPKQHANLNQQCPSLGNGRLHTSPTGADLP